MTLSSRSQAGVWREPKKKVNKQNPSQDLENVRFYKVLHKTLTFLLTSMPTPGPTPMPTLTQGGSAIALPVLSYRRAKNVNNNRP